MSYRLHPPADNLLRATLIGHIREQLPPDISVDYWGNNGILTDDKTTGYSYLLVLRGTQLSSYINLHEKIELDLIEPDSIEQLQQLICQVGDEIIKERHKHHPTH